MNQRKLAINTLTQILENNGYNNIVLNRNLNKFNNLTAQQKAKVTDLVNGTLRNIIHIDYIINIFSKTNTSKMDKIVLYSLRISVYEIFYTHTSHYAICNEAVNIVKSKTKHLASFVNGFLRNLIRNKDNISYPKDKTQYFSIVYSIPLWLLEYFATFLSDQEIENFCKASNNPPSLSLYVNTLLTTKEDLLKQLKNEQVVTKIGNFKNSIFITKTNNLNNLESFTKGYFHIIDEASIEAVMALCPKPFSTVYDICAAPGGKSFLMAYLMDDKGKIIATDIHQHKINLLQDGAKRLNITSIKPMVNDATKSALPQNNADYVLLDAPCSGFGTLSKKPDIKYTKNKKNIIELANLQKQLLKSTAKYAKIGGHLLYSTCTISVEENQNNIDWFLKTYDYIKIEEKQTIPNLSGSDGFYFALLQRRS